MKYNQKTYRYCVVHEDGRARDWGMAVTKIERTPENDSMPECVTVVHVSGLTNTFALSKTRKFYAASNMLFNPAKGIDSWLKACEEDYKRGVYKWR